MFSNNEESHFARAKESLVELYDRLPVKMTSMITEPAIKWVKTILSFFSDLRVEALHLHFRSGYSNESLKILFIGSKDRLHFLRGLIGIDDFELCESAHLFLWEIKDYIKDREPEADAVVVNVNRILFGILFKPQGSDRYLRIPDCVQSVLKLPGSFEEVKKKFSESTLRKIRNVIKEEYTCKELHDESALKNFYHEMYVPHCRKRFGKLAVIASYPKARRLLRTGFIVAVQKENECMSGAICRIRGDAFIFELVGVENGRPHLLEKGALDALYYFCILSALEKNCGMINFGNSRPFLNDGLVRYKRKWGTGLIRNRKQQREIGIKCNGSSESGYHFFLDNYPVFLNEKGISALILSDEAKPVDMKYMRHIKKAYHCPGVERLVLLSPSGFDEEAEEHYGKGSEQGVELIRTAPGDWNVGEILNGNV